MTDFKVSIADLKYRIIIQKQGDIPDDDNGFPTSDGFDNYKATWASINNLFGKEFWSAKAVQSENTLEFVIRYSRNFLELNSKEYRIKWKDRTFNITFIDNIKYENKWIKIKAIEVQ